MGKRSRRGAGNVSRSLAREHGSDSAHAMSGSARAEAFDDRPGRQSGEPDRGGPGLERDPYRDEGGEGVGSGTVLVRRRGVEPEAGGTGV
jgi:hypothetical protein